MSHTSLGLHGLLDGSQTVLELGVGSIVLQTGLVRIVGADKVALAVEGSTFAAPALGPVRLDLGGLDGVVQGMVPVLLGSVSGGAVGVEDVVLGLEGNGLRELVAVRKRRQYSVSCRVSRL